MSSGKAVIPIYKAVTDIITLNKINTPGIIHLYQGIIIALTYLSKFRHLFYAVLSL